MKKSIVALFLCASLLLTGCSLLTREYSAVTPHSASYYESGNSSVLRAENYQDLVNDILILVGQHTDSGTIWFYPEADTEDIHALIGEACREAQEDTPMGSYTVDFLSYTLNEQHAYVEIALSLGYRRSAQQVDAMIHTTSLSALQTLLTTAAEEGRAELVLQVAYFSDEPQTVYDAVAAIQAEVAGDDAEPWEVNLYPAEGTVGIVEIILEK